MDSDAALRERERDPAGADAELECCAAARELGQEVHDRADDGRVEELRQPLVVARGHALAEVVLGHCYWPSGA